MKTLIVMPAYNEADTLAAAVASLDALNEDYELLIVNDGSRDRTGALADELAEAASKRTFVVHLPINSGVGATVQTGYRFAAQRGDYDYVIQFDADGQHDVAYVPALVAACERDGLDLCIGSRFLDRENRDFLSTRLRRVGIRLISGLISTLLGIRITDPTGGFRCAGRRAWRSFARYYPEEYAEPESLFWCVRHGMKVAETPVRMHARQGGVSSMHLSKEMYYMLKVSSSILIDRVRRRERWMREA